MEMDALVLFFFSSRRRHTRCSRDWSSDVCSSDLHFWTSDVLAAWLVIYAAGNLTLIADAGLQLRAVNRFFAFKSSADCDGRTARFYAAMLRIYCAVAGLLVVLLLAGTWLLPPS